MAPCNPGLQPPSVALLLFADTAPGEDTRDSVLPDSSPAGGALRPLLGVKVAERQPPPELSCPPGHHETPPPGLCLLALLGKVRSSSSERSEETRRLLPWVAEGQPAFVFHVEAGGSVEDPQDGAGRRFNTHRRGDGRAAEEAEIGHKTKAAGSSQKLLQARTLLQPSDSCDPASTLIRAQ
ncbi:uncharacterized protein LOC118143628 isoform X1 [Callithrix jacchus]